MTLKEIGEFGFIKKISRGCLIRPDNIVKAIGDDAAAFKTDAGRLSLVTTDLLVERIHFLRDAISGFDLGYKSLAVNLSDIAAMGGTAREAFVSIAIPENCPLEYLEDIYRGMKDLAARYEVNILGGDTTRSKIDLILNVAVHGEVAEKEMLCRDAARVGDIVFSTGFLGDRTARPGCI
jgi:thiamine-monophosphate kinase